MRRLDFSFFFRHSCFCLFVIMPEITELSRLMSKKQRSQQAQPVPSAPADSQVLVTGQGSSRSDKVASEDGLSEGDSDESGAVIRWHYYVAR
jgi:hypothetical protein